MTYMLVNIHFIQLTISYPTTKRRIYLKKKLGENLLIFESSKDCKKHFNDSSRISLLVVCNNLVLRTTQILSAGVTHHTFNWDPAKLPKQSLKFITNLSFDKQQQIKNFSRLFFIVQRKVIFMAFSGPRFA